MAATQTVDVVMPQMGVSVSEGTVTKWLKQVGEKIEADESLLEISTDKVDTEVPSPGTGVVAEILVQEGETVDVGTKLAVIAPEGAEASAPAEAPPEPATQEAAAEVAQAAPAEATPPTREEPAPAPAAQPQPAAATGDGRAFVSPVVARIAAEHGVDPGRVPGTGRGGRVTKQDILQFIEQGGEPTEAPSEPEAVQAPPKAPPEPPAAPAEAPPEPPRPARTAAPAAAEAELAPGEQEEPVTAMRRGIAEHMRRSLDTAAHVTSAIEVDMSRVVAIREK